MYEIENHNSISFLTLEELEEYAKDASLHLILPLDTPIRWNDQLTEYTLGEFL